jgi:hypothetical protein
MAFVENCPLVQCGFINAPTSALIASSSHTRSELKDTDQGDIDGQEVFTVGSHHELLAARAPHINPL